MTRSSSPSRSTLSTGSLLLTREYITRGRAFEQEAQRILATHETSKNRAITVEQTYSQLGALTVKQDRLLRQSLECISFSLFRASYVLSWAALMDFLEQKLAEDDFNGLSKVREKWKVRSLDNLRENHSDYQIISAIQALDFCSQNDEKALKALLTERNESAHPSDYEPELNETLGYVSKILKRLGTLQKRWSKP